jgi:hypothetical protein
MKNRKHAAAVAAARPHYDQLLAAQGGVCGICEKPPKEGQRRFHIDTEHKGGTYEIRGLLCFHCNLVLHRHVTILWLIRAAVYLARFEARRLRS